MHYVGSFYEIYIAKLGSMNIKFMNVKYCNTFLSEDATNPTLQYSKKIIYEINAVVYILNRQQNVSHKVFMSTVATTGHPARCSYSMQLNSPDERHDKAVSLYFNRVRITWIHSV